MFSRISNLNGLRPDIVPLHPGVGVAVFEVKDWDLGAMQYYALATMPSAAAGDCGDADPDGTAASEDEKTARL